MERIESIHNPRLKDVALLAAKSSLRRERGQCVVEGRREISNAVAAGFALEQLYFCPDIVSEDDLKPLLESAGQVFSLSSAAYSKIAYREGTEGAVAVMKTNPLNLESLSVASDALVIVLESVEKPGNLGAILRSADASGAAARYLPRRPQGYRSHI